MTVLRLEKCGISDASGVAIATMLAAGNCASLLELALPHNQLGQASAAAFGDLLQVNQTLQCLDLSWNLLQVSSPSNSPSLMTRLHLNMVWAFPNQPDVRSGPPRSRIDSNQAEPPSIPNPKPQTLLESWPHAPGLAKL